MAIKILIIIILLTFVLSNRLEPLNIVLNREKFYFDNFGNVTNNLELKKDSSKGYFCQSKDHIRVGDPIFTIPKNISYSVFDEFPFKNKFFEILNDNDIILKNTNLTGNILLTTRLLFDLKANITEIFILTKKYENKIDYSFNEFKNYLKSRNSFFFEFLKNLPLISNLGQTSWSDEEINEFELTGFLPVFKNKIIKIYNFLREEFGKDPILKELTNSWFNESNLNYFLSLYGYVISRSFKIELKDFSNENTQNLINVKIDKHGGNIIIPFIELCNHYHPKVNDGNALLKTIKINVHEETILINALSDYKKNEEFNFSYSNLLTNDYLLLNYGFIVRNNPFQEFVFRFDVDDPKFKFYKTLEKNKFNMNQIAIIGNEKLAIHFSLKYNNLSKDLEKFINVFMELNNFMEDERHELKSYRKLKTELDQSTFNKLKVLFLYFSTIDKNIKTINDSLENKSIMYYLDKINETNSKINKLNQIIEDNTNNFITNRNLTQNKNDDDLQNLFYFKNLHNFIKKKLIQEFNLENIKIIFSHQNLVLRNVESLLCKSILKLKLKYI